MGAREVVELLGEVAVHYSTLKYYRDSGSQSFEAQLTAVGGQGVRDATRRLSDFQTNWRVPDQFAMRMRQYPLMFLSETVTELVATEGSSLLLRVNKRQEKRYSCLDGALQVASMNGRRAFSLVPGLLLAGQPGRDDFLGWFFDAEASIRCERGHIFVHGRKDDEERKIWLDEFRSIVRVWESRSIAAVSAESHEAESGGVNCEASRDEIGCGDPATAALGDAIHFVAGHRLRLECEVIYESVESR